jgi:membrane associated rhomboid family serine protease
MSEKSSFLHIYVFDRPISVACAVAVVLISSLNLIISEPVNTLSLIPVNTLIANKFVWNVVTCAFYEKYLMKIILDCILLIITVKNIEINSKEQAALYFLATTIITSFLTSAVYFIDFFISKIEAPLVQPTYGFSGVYIALLTFCRFQYSNESVHPAFPQITYQNLPVLYLLLQAIFFIVGVNTLSNDILFAIISLFVSWTYLRFIYRFQEDGPLGNTNEDFAFVAMFPDVSFLLDHLPLNFTCLIHSL